MSKNFEPTPLRFACGDVGISNIRTMKITGKVDPRNTPGKFYAGIMDPATRELRARLILEEALETINALGVVVTQDGGTLAIGHVHFLTRDEYDHEGVIDGICDTIYVAEGTAVAAGVPIRAHMAEVVRANEAKFPGGVAVTNPLTGKYQKPVGWTPPDHMRAHRENIELFAFPGVADEDMSESAALSYEKQIGAV